MKSILIISYVKPYPPDSGGSSGVYHMIDGLKDLFSFTLVFPVIESHFEYEELKRKWPNVNLYPVIIPSPKGIRGSIKSGKRWLRRNQLELKQKFSADPDLELKRRSILFHRSFFKNKQFKEEVQQLIKKYHFDLIQVEFYQILPIVELLNMNTPKLFIHHEIRYIKAQREYELLQNKKEEYQSIINDIKREESSFLKIFEHIITFSEIDKKALLDGIPHEKIHVSPLFVQLSKIKTENFKFSHKLTFIGSSKHFPNAEGLMWFLKFSWKEIRHRVPDLTLLITGHWEKRYKKEIKKYPGVKLTGFVDDLQKKIAGSIVIVPIRIGSGMRMKIIDAVNFGLPFITTSIGVEGLDFRHNRECLIANTPSLFTEAVINLCRDTKLQEKLITNADKALREKYKADIALQKRKEVYQKIFKSSN